MLEHPRMKCCKQNILMCNPSAAPLIDHSARSHPFLMSNLVCMRSCINEKELLGELRKTLTYNVAPGSAVPPALPNSAFPAY